MKNYDLDKIYSDFFSSSLVSESKETIDEEFDLDNIKKDINALFVDDESKNILIKIVDYMVNYYDKKEINNINFNLKIVSDNNEETCKIINILKKVNNYTNYYKNSNIINYSLYKVNKENDINDLYDKYGIVSIYDLDVLTRKELDFNKNFFYTFKECLEKNNVTIISGSKKIIDEFINNDNLLSSKYFLYEINVIMPNVDNIIKQIKEKLNNIEIDEISLKEYIINTKDKKDTDYLTYRDNIINYISFNKEVPKLQSNKSNEEIFEELNNLVGLDSVKEKLHDLEALISLKKKTQDDLKIGDLNLHMVFLGNPGTGKTTVARMISGILYNLNYIRQNKLIEVSSKDLVGQYVGQTAPKTMEVVNKALGGVLFIDEAYALETKNSDNSYNAEAIATLIKAMEDYRNDLVVIFAGYTKEMQDFLDSNSGIVSRIGYTFEFSDYTNDELIKIFKQMASKSGFILTQDCDEKLNQIINDNRDMKNFGNARFIRNVYEKTIVNHANNTKDLDDNNKLKTITKEDICV